MAIILNDNIKINAGKPSESKYLNSSNAAYISTGATVAAIPISERYLGLTVLIDTGTSNVEYWWREGVADIDLVEKKFASEQVVGDFITGATNLGFFSGKTGVQTLLLSGFPSSPVVFDGIYNSEYNWYYADAGGIIRIGSPTHDGPLRRAYVSPSRTKSWIWNVATSAWILSNSDVVADVGFGTNPYGYNGTGYTQVDWSTGFHTNLSTSITASGSLTTGSTLTIGNPVYSDKANQDLHFRTILNETPQFLKITNDENYVRFSGVSSVITATNYGSGIGVYSGLTGTNLKFRTLVPSGDTTITTRPDGKLVVYSSSDGSANALTGATNEGIGIGIYSGITDRNMHFRTIVGTGDTIVTLSGDTIVVDSSGMGGLYNLASPSAIPLGGICSGTVLTGKTSFQLFEELLVPELFGTVTAPSVTSVGLSHSGLREIDCNISQTVTINFTRGCITPQYCSLSDKRSGAANAYCFTGTGMPAGLQACTSLSASAVNASYDVLIGTQSWGGYTRFNAGSPALSNKGNQYCAALVSGSTGAGSNSIVGVYPLWGTTSTIAPPLTSQALQNMSTANNILVSLVAESGGNKQKFEIPCAWLGAPTSRPLAGVCQWNTVSSQWEYPGGSQGTSLALWTASSASETVQGNSVGYCQYTYNGVDRSAVCIRLVF